ncbi:MAG TPA: DegV family protein [Candidatus Limnocylindrales bacterium]
MTVAIVTDSGSDLTPAELAASGVRQVSLSVSFGDQSYQSPDELTPEAFWEKMVAPDSPFALTAAPSVGQFRLAFEQAFAEGHESVVCVCLSSGLSSTVKHAQMASEMLDAKEIFVIDSKTASIGVGSLALRGAEMAKAGATGREVFAELGSIARRLDLYCALDTLQYLRKGGRIGAAKAAIGGLLAVKPILTMEDAVAVITDQPRTRSKATARMLEILSARPAVELHLVYSPPTDIEAFKKLVLAEMPGPAPTTVTTHVLGPVIGAHIGPGAFGAILIREDA